ncbi:hypothetical protein J2S21_002669 [Peribacillus cavernae]|nr:hypothetical protein [Peribacillus cavernae]
MKFNCDDSFPILKTERLTLREIVNVDNQTIFAIFSYPIFNDILCHLSRQWNRPKLFLKDSKIIFLKGSISVRQ